jgi:hypothetical protein
MCGCDDRDRLALCTLQVHGPQCLQCTYSIIRKVSEPRPHDMVASRSLSPDCAVA